MAAETNADNTGPWEAAIEQLREWDASWAEACERMTPTRGVPAFCHVDWSN